MVCDLFYLYCPFVIHWTMAYQRCPPYTWNMWVLLYHGKRDFADVIKDVEMGIVPDYSHGSRGITGLLRVGWKSQREVRVREKMMWPRHQRSAWCTLERKGPQAKEYRQLPEAGKVKERDPLLRSPEKISPADTLTLARWNWLQISGLQNVR